MKLAASILFITARVALSDMSHSHGSGAKFESWEEHEPIPFSLSDQTANAIGDKIYLIGGCIGHQVGYTCPAVSSKIAVFNAKTKTYETDNIPDLPSPRYRHATVVLHDKIFVMGGRDAADNVIATTDVYDLATNTWSTLSFTWTNPRSDNDAFVMGNLIYVVGGYDAAYTDYSTTDILNPESGWTLGSTATTIAPMLVARGDFAVVEHDGLYYAFGGWTSANGFCAPLNSAEYYDPKTDSWTAIANLKVARGDKASGVLDGRIFAIGGETSSCDSTSSVPLPSQPVTDVEAFDTDKTEAGWVAVSSIPEHKFRFASAAVGDTIYVFGGQRTEQFCPHASANCNPISNHTWGFTADHSHDHDSDEGLDSGAIAGIVVACVGVAVALAALVYCHLRGTHQRNAEKHIELSDPQHKEVRV